jgi:hypothetical protein
LRSRSRTSKIAPAARSHKTIAHLRGVPIKVVRFVMAPMASVRLVALLFLDTGSITGVIRRGQRQALLPGVDVHCSRPGDDAAAPGTAFDPAGLANPSKLFPTPAGCAESAKHKAVLLGGGGWRCSEAPRREPCAGAHSQEAPRMRWRSRRLMPKAATAPKRGSGPGTGLTGPG